MKQLLTIFAALGLAGAAYADCGKKVASIGELEKYDAVTKALTLKIVDSSDPKEVEAKSAKLTMTPDSKVIAEGDLQALVGKKVTVVSEHGKVDFVILLAAK
ncbi:MAG TPA: hypothetical protein VMN36_16160 [Verrucomicrobiales bacterium]|nr:hypothetical protein [Verrucomicrobiales bacterium]